LVDQPALIDRLLEVLCGVEALSAQRWAVGAISLCAVDFRDKRKEWDLSPETNFKGPFRLRAN
jgi:hypothetical protein